MSFISRNHPQQVAERGALDTVDDRWTPLHLWIPWNDRWQFTLDAAASEENHLCDRYYTLADDGLAQSWAMQRVWCNPPYSGMADWVHKAWNETTSGCELVVMLAPANRTEQRWWQEFVEPYRDGRSRSQERVAKLSTEFLPRRINFGSRDNLGAWSASSAPFGCVLLVWESLRA